MELKKDILELGCGLNFGRGSLVMEGGNRE